MQHFASAVHVIGATGRTGAALCGMLERRGSPVVAVVRDATKWAALGLTGQAREADLTSPDTVRAALSDATRVISVSYAAWTRTVLDAAPEQARVVITGSARSYSRLPDADGDAARRAEQHVLGCGRDAAILHPTMIYGAAGDGTVSRLASVIARWPVLPLPGGSRPRVQPIHVADVAACLIAAIDRHWEVPRAIALGGPDALPYADFVRLVAQVSGRKPILLPVPPVLVRIVARRNPAVLRLLEDRVVDIGPMRALLGIDPRALSVGLGLGRTTGLEPATSKTTTWRSTN